MTPTWPSSTTPFPQRPPPAWIGATRFALWAARAALADAGLAAPGGSRAGTVVGAGLGVVRLEDVARHLGPDGRFDARRFAAGGDAVRPDSQIRCPADLPTASIARHFGLGGPSLTVTTACASATQAIGTAFRLIRRGEADWAVCGGADSMLHPVGLVYFVLLRAASQSADPPETVCRPFDRRRSGLVMGEGAGMVVLESEPHARARGGSPLGRTGRLRDVHGRVRAHGASPSGRGRGAGHGRRAGGCGIDVRGISTTSTPTGPGPSATTPSRRRPSARRSARRRTGSV